MQKTKSADLLKGHLGRDKKLTSQIKSTAKLKKDLEKSFRSNDLLLKESSGFIEAEEGEDLLRLRQKDLIPLLPTANAERTFNLDLQFGYYSIDYTRSGKYLALAGSKGHIAIMDWKTKDLKCEFNAKEKIRDIKFLHNETMYAVAQKKCLYIYDNTGTELHRLKTHPEPLHIEFLPYHFLLASISKEGTLAYQDVSTGQVVAEHKTKIKEAACLVQNPYNGVLLAGDSRGQVTMWCPNTGVPIVKMLCHKSRVNTVCVDNSGHNLVTAGTDGQMKVWDIRTYKSVHDYWNPTPATKLSISQRGLLCVGLPNQIQIWKDWYQQKQKKPYLKEDTYQGKILNDCQFIPFEDFLGVGLIDGFSTLVVPGAGEANFDTFEANPYQTTKQRAQEVVVKLLDKLPPDSITLDPTIIGTMDKASREVIASEKKAEHDEEERKREVNRKRRVRSRGRSGTKEKFLGKEAVHDKGTRDRIREIMNSKLKMKQLEKKKMREEQDLIRDGSLLDSFDPVEQLIKKVKKN